MHFCGGHLINVSVFEKSSDGCCKGKEHHDAGSEFTLSKKCCGNNVASLKVNDDHLIKNVAAGVTLPIAPPYASLTNSLTLPLPNSFVVPSWHSPPERQCCDVYLVNCNFRI